MSVDGMKEVQTVEGVKEKLDAAKAEIEVKKIDMSDGGKGREAIEPLPNEYPPVNVKTQKTWRVDFQPEVTAAEIGLFFNTIGFAINSEDMVKKLSMCPGIKFKEVNQPLRIS